MAKIRISARPASYDPRHPDVVAIAYGKGGPLLQEFHEVKSVDAAEALVKAADAKLRASIGEGYSVSAWVDDGRRPNGWDAAFSKRLTIHNPKLEA